MPFHPFESSILCLIHPFIAKLYIITIAGKSFLDYLDKEVYHLNEDDNILSIFS